MPLVKLNLRPGIVRDATEYSASGGWWDCNRVRFSQGQPETIGGWVRYTTEAFEGICRTLFRHVDNSGNVYTFLGTTTKLYVESGGSLTDITPVRATTTPNNVIDTTDTLGAINITDTAHGASVGDSIIVSGASDVGGLVAATYINKEHVITEVVDANNYKVDTGGTATSTVANGGGSLTIQYLYFTGTNATTFGTGWGTGTWGHDTWGSDSDTPAVLATTRVWHMDNFGEDMVINARNGAVFYWDATTPTARAVYISTLAGAANTPEIASRILVSQNSRHVVAFGCDPLSSSTQNKLLVRWSDQEDAADWTPSTTNQAGDYILSRGAEIVAAVQTRSDILIFTDKALYNMQYIGGQLVFGFTVVADNIYVAGPNSAIAHNDVVYWMARSGFYMWSGRVQHMVCPVETYLFNDVDWSEGSKVFACTNSIYNEVTWFYQSVNADEVDKYVTYNYVENVWYYGSLPRTAWVENPGGFYPLAASTDGYLYQHEFGHCDGSESGLCINAYIESGPIEIGDGDKFLFVDRLIPDIDFTGSDSATPAVTMTLSTRNYPGGASFGTETNSIVRVTSDPQTFTTKKNVRLRGRTIKLRIDTSETGTYWRSGGNRIDVREDGTR